MPSASAWFRSVTSHAGAAANDRSSCTCTARSRCSLPGRSWRSSKYRVGGSATRARTRESTFSSSGSTSGDHDGGGDSIDDDALTWSHARTSGRAETARQDLPDFENCNWPCDVTL